MRRKLVSFSLRQGEVGSVSLSLWLLKEDALGYFS